MDKLSLNDTGASGVQKQTETNPSANESSSVQSGDTRLVNGGAAPTSSNVVASTNPSAETKHSSNTAPLQQIRVNIKCARFTPNGGLFNTKADIYVEMIIDGSPSRKTEIARKTWTPAWNENFDVLITSTSRKKVLELLETYNVRNRK